jgi:mannose-1-phosphate guanylyltransferase
MARGVGSHVFVALLAGGRGARFWPLSRRATPKQLLDMTGEGPLARRTLERLGTLVRRENVLVVTSPDLAPALRRLLDVPAANVLAEPAPRNTAAAVGLALVVALARDPDAIVLALPADHHVGRPARLRAILRSAAAAAARLRVPVLLGMSPTSPSSDYGYIVPGERVRGAPGLRRVRRFVEKPARAGAQRLLRSRALWNGGMFCLHAASALDLMRRVAPEMGEPLAALLPHVGRRTFGAALRRTWALVPSIAFDRAVLERCDDACVLPADIGWSDVGTFEALAALIPADAARNRTRGPAFLAGSEECLVVERDASRTLVLFGVRDLLVVDAGDVVLVAPRGADLQRLVARLDRERPELT